MNSEVWMQDDTNAELCMQHVYVIIQLICQVKTLPIKIVVRCWRSQLSAGVAIGTSGDTRVFTRRRLISRGCTSVGCCEVVH